MILYKPYYVISLDFSNMFNCNELFFNLYPKNLVDHMYILFIQNNIVTQNINYVKFYEKVTGVEIYKVYPEEEFKIHYERLFKKPWKE